MGDVAETVDAELTDDERLVLHRGLVEWGGPAGCTDLMARAMGFHNVSDLVEEGERIAGDLEAGRPLSRRDWTRALLATEIVFSSDVLGSGVEWPTTTGLADVQTLLTLRQLQVKLAGVVLRRGDWE